MRYLLPVISTAIGLTSFMFPNPTLHESVCNMMVAPVSARESDSNVYIKSRNGIEYYDYIKGSQGAEIHNGDTLLLNVRGYLAGRQGWTFIDTFNSKDGEAIRLTLGETSVIKGLELGILGDNDAMQPMKKGSKRRLLIPSRLGFQSQGQQPEPKDEGAKRRLYSTVLNNVRGDRERLALGDSIVGKLILDVEVIRMTSKK
jgi:hypothetical protein